MGRVLLAVGVVAFVAACASEDAPTTADAASSSSSTTTATSAPPTTVDEEAAILTAVDGYWKTIRDSSNPADPSHPGFDRYFTGEALEHSKSVTSDRLSQGHAVRLPHDSAYRHSPQIVVLETDRAEVRDCAVDDSVLFDVETGQILNDDVVTFDWSLVLRRVNSSWRVSSASVIAQWEGATSCAS